MLRLGTASPEASPSGTLGTKRSGCIGIIGLTVGTEKPFGDGLDARNLAHLFLQGCRKEGKEREWQFVSCAWQDLIVYDLQMETTNA